MNRNRINQILSVLLFPFCDPLLGKTDKLNEKFQKYVEIRKNGIKDSTQRIKREKSTQEYKKLCEELQKYLEGCNEGRIKSYDDIMQLCELYYPQQDYIQLFDRITRDSHWKEEGGKQGEIISCFYLKKLRNIAESMLTYRDGIVAIRTWPNQNFSGETTDLFSETHIFDKVEIWNILCRFTVPDIYIVIFAQQCNLGKEAFYAQRPFISLADKLLIKCLNKGIAENHMHLNAGFDYITAWLHCMDLSFWSDSTVNDKKMSVDDIRFIQAAVFRCFAAVFCKKDIQDLELSFAKWIGRTAGLQLGKLLLDMKDGVTNAIGNIKPAIKKLEKILNPESQEIAYDFLLETVYVDEIELKTSSEFLLLYDCCRYICQNGWDTAFCQLFLQYLRIKNAVFQKGQQRFGVGGLKYFQQYFNASKELLNRAVQKEAAMLEVFRSQAKIRSLRKLEIRIGPRVDKVDMDCLNYEACRDWIKEQLCGQLWKVFYVYRRYILENIVGVQMIQSMLENEKKEKEQSGFSYRILPGKLKHIEGSASIGGVPMLGIVYHFLKTERMDDLTGCFCWRKLKAESFRYSSHSMIIRQHMANIAMAIEELRGEIPLLDEYVVGIDAASDENAMEPWMFAPVYNSMRSRNVSKPIRVQNSKMLKYCAIQNIGFTYHVGEDFRHIISGLRHIDEVIEQFHYKPGDRLGHAIALGIDIDKWGSDNEAVPLTVLEYMENLLWMWGINVYEGIDLPVQLEKIEEKILTIAGSIYSCAETITVRMLYEAYQMKFSKEHIKILEKQEKKFVITGKNQEDLPERMQSHGKKMYPDFCYYCSNTETEDSHWTAEKLLCTNYCPVFEEKYNRVTLVCVPENEIKTYKRLQEYLIEKVEQRGIYVETNPTSNLTIGEFSNFKEHPIFRMNTLKNNIEKGHHVMVTINSDDPAVFQTNVENELAYIYYAAEHAGVAKEDILNWIDRIRENGLNASFLQYEKGAGQMLEEISGILDDIAGLENRIGHI